MGTDDEELQRAVGRRIAELRRELHETQEEFADRYGATPKYVRLVEAGGENLTLATMNRLARVLQVAVVELLVPPNSMRANKGRPRGSPSRSVKKKRAP